MSGFEGLPLFGEGRTLYDKEPGRRFETARVLITVKAAPQPSEKYGDTVCVAGIRMREGTGPEWIRLYPIPFRSMEELEKFQKYELVEVNVMPSNDDFRSESYKPDRSSLVHLEQLPPWKRRHPFVQPLADRWTMCEILSAMRGRQPYPSLAVVRPRSVEDLEVSLHPGWSETQQAKIDRAANQLDLFDDGSRRPAPLEAPRFTAHFHYTCMTPSCRGHRQSLIDWEASELVRRHHAGDDDPTAAQALRVRFFTEMADPSREPLFFVGNQAQKPAAFAVLGVYRSNSRT